MQKIRYLKSFETFQKLLSLLYETMSRCGPPPLPTSTAAPPPQHLVMNSNLHDFWLKAKSLWSERRFGSQQHSLSSLPFKSHRFINVSLQASHRVIALVFFFIAAVVVFRSVNEYFHGFNIDRLLSSNSKQTDGSANYLYFFHLSINVIFHLLSNFIWIQSSLRYANHIKSHFHLDS